MSKANTIVSKELKSTTAAVKAVLPKIQKERAEFNKLIIDNPNYFGTFPELKTKAVLAMKANTQYEELSCLGFYPDTDTLEAVIQTKLAYGYGGNLCSPGSMEYVRFFIDWNGDGTFDDVGIASVNVHDMPDAGYTCIEKAKPLSYAINVKISSKKKICAYPNLVKVRAILSWSLPPPAGNPNYSPPWGNVLEKWIQIKPLKLLLKDIISVANLGEFKVTPQMLDLDMEISVTPALTVMQLKELYAKEKVPEHRYNVGEIAQAAQQIKINPALLVPYKLNPNLAKFIENVTPVLVESPKTTYEELTCVGLNYDTDTFVATIKVKLPSGFSGSLCTKGSYEYVAFWAYVWDQIEGVCYWKHLGNTNVNVHDIKNIPNDGLHYAAFLTCDLSDYKDKCAKPRVLKVRGILSWNIPPPASNPSYVPIWGNVVDALVQLKPTQNPIVPGQQVPFISVVGGMAIESIAGNPYSTILSSLGDGYGNGPSVNGGFSGWESPFVGVVTISGHISNPPNDPSDATKLKYKVQYRKVGQNWHELTNTFRIWISKWDGFGWTMSHKDQMNADGYYLYEEDLDPPVQRFVEGDVLAQWITPVPDGDGLYEIRMLLQKLGAPASPGVPADHVSSNIVRVLIDNTRPTAQISLDVGPCAKIKLGDTITGKITATDAHIANYTIAMEPSLPNMPVIVPPTSESWGPAMPAPGRTDWPFQIKTTATTSPCGYVIHLHVWDRAIVNNSRPGYYSGATIGLCLLEK